jgi:ribonuclease J
MLSGGKIAIDVGASTPLVLGASSIYMGTAAPRLSGGAMVRRFASGERSRAAFDLTDECRCLHMAGSDSRRAHLGARAHIGLCTLVLRSMHRMPTGKLHIVPLGGLGEFGMNCMAVRWGDDIIVIDGGLMFPEAELLGVDIVVPDISYLTENRQRVKGIILTHGHEDHIGALPWILSELNVPVWGTEFTLAYVEDKLEEHGLLDDADLREIRAGESFKIGPFTIKPIQVTHSLVDCVALAVHTPLGVIIHTGDFKVDPTPTDNRLFDLHAFAEYGKAGVLALFQDSTNVERKGYTPSERAVRRKFDEVFAHTKRRLFISCFSSSIHRIKLAVEMAWQHGRKVAFAGRSMNNSAEIAEDLGYIEIPEGLLIHPGEMKNFPPEKVCVLISGTQGEPMSALSRAAVDNHKHAKIEKGDTVMLSSRIIPGNEKAIYRMIDHLFRREAHVIYDDGSSPPVHVSGHASQEELKLIINLVKPKYFIPIHGEYRQLKLHAEMAAAMKGSVGNVILIESGDVLEIDELGARKAGRVNVGRVCIDSGSRTDVVEDLIVKDRRHLSEDGIVLPIIAINKLTGKVETTPEIVTRGFSPGEDGFVDGARQVVMQTLDSSSAEEKADYGVIKEKIRADLKRYVSKQTQKRPLIMPVILEI